MIAKGRITALVALMLALSASLIYAQDQQVSTDLEGIYRLESSFGFAYHDSLISADGTFKLRLGASSFTDTASTADVRLESGFLPVRMIPVATIEEVGRVWAHRQTTLDSVCQNDPQALTASGSEVESLDEGYAWLTDTKNQQVISPWNTNVQLTEPEIAMFPQADTTISVIAFNGNYQSIPDTARVTVRRLDAVIKVGSVVFNPTDTSRAKRLSIPITLEGGNNLSLCQPDSLAMTVRLNRSLFFPSQLTKGRLERVASSGDQLLKLFVPFDPQSDLGSVITEIEGTGLLGDDSSTVISADSIHFGAGFSWFVGADSMLALWYRDSLPYYHVSTEVASGLLALDSICLDGGPRLIDYEDRTLGISRVAPNPFIDRLHIDITGVSAAPVSLFVSSNEGRIIQKVVIQHDGSSNHIHTDLQLSDIPEGGYFVIVAQEKQVRSHLVVKSR